MKQQKGPTAFTAEQVKELTLDPASTSALDHGEALLVSVFLEHGVQAIPILLVATREALIHILHAVTPMPEANVEAVKGMIADLEMLVSRHYPCAVDLNHTTTTKGRAN